MVVASNWSELSEHERRFCTLNFTDYSFTAYLCLDPVASYFQ
jgi:hypothetical protein